MRFLFTSVVVFLLLSLTISNSIGQSLPKISIDYDNKSFVDENGNDFFPWGFNYIGSRDAFEFMEDVWESESTWDSIRQDFENMKGYCANVVRLHLQCHEYMIAQDTPNQVALDNLERLIGIAEDVGLYLDITGLAAYRKADQPIWYDEMDDLNRWITHRNFWKAIAEVGKESSNVLCYNLMNEPIVSVCKQCPGEECPWLNGDGFGGFHFVQNITRQDSRPRVETTKSWINMLSCAIKEIDPNSLVTLGTLSLLSVAEFPDELDYLSPHYYPRSGLIRQGIDHIKANNSNRPLVIEETSTLRCSDKELEQFLDGIDGHYQGLMMHYFGTLEELEADNDLVSALHYSMMQVFIDNNPNNENCSCPQATMKTYYEDIDGDNFGSSNAQIACRRPVGFVRISGDCNDLDSLINPSIHETCDGLDNDCNQLIDDDFECTDGCMPWITTNVINTTQDGSATINWEVNNGLDTYPFVLIDYLTGQVIGVEWSNTDELIFSGLSTNTFYSYGALSGCAGQIIPRSAPDFIYIPEGTTDPNPCNGEARIRIGTLNEMEHIVQQADLNVLRQGNNDNFYSKKNLEDIAKILSEIESSNSKK